MRKLKIVLAAGLLLLGAACGDDDDTDDATGDTEAAAVTKIDVTATEYAFAVPATIKGGTVEMTYTNAGKEPHFAAFAKATDGKTFADIKAAFSAPPSAGPPSVPPPFVEWAGSPTADPGTGGKLTFDLPAGTYALFCAIPAPDGAPHVAKGMLTEVTVTEGETVDLPDAAGTITAEDFSLTAVPDLEEGSNVVKLQNNGKQLHEINLVEVGTGKKIDDIVAWATAPAGPPPHKSLGGVAVKPEEDGTAEFDLKKGTTYAFICVIPDSLGDGKPHLAKGMATGTFTV